MFGCVRSALIVFVTLQCSAASSLPLTDKAWNKLVCRGAVVGQLPRTINDASEISNSGPPISFIAIDLDDTLIPEERSKKVALKFINRLWQEIRFEYDSRFPRSPLSSRIVALQTISTIVSAIRGAHKTLTIEQQLIESVTKSFKISPQEAQTLVSAVVDRAYDVLRPSFGRIDGAPELIAWLKAKGFPLILATTPRWPLPRIHERALIGDIQPSDFIGITDWASYRAAKPHAPYYQQMFERHDLNPLLGLMVGNDIDKDCIPPLKEGMSGFWFVECASFGRITAAHSKSTWLLDGKP